MRIILLAALFISTAAALAQDKPKPPVVSDVFKAKFFKAKSQMQDAQLALEQTPQYKAAQQKQFDMQALITEFQSFCGKGFQPQLDKDGDPSCVVVETPKEPKK
jgi:hypothetical protein